MRQLRRSWSDPGAGGETPGTGTFAPAPTGRQRTADRWGTRALDAVVSGSLLIVLAVPIALIVLAIRIESRGPGFYRCRRIGFQGRELEMLKFRKMHRDATGPALTATRDERFTRLGPWLAATKLDELPQLWNVLKGEMSLVGPRPEDPSFVVEQADSYRVILQVRPGITGLSQLAFAKESTILDPEDSIGHYVTGILPQKVRLDLLYAEQRTLLGDLRILFWTAAAVLLRRDVAVHRDTGRLGVRRRPRLQTAPSPAQATVALGNSSNNPSA